MVGIVSSSNKKILSFFKSRGLLFQLGASLFIRALGTCSGFMLSIVLARKLGAENAGFYFLAFGLITFLSAISRVGLDNTVLRITGASSPTLESGRKQSVLLKALAITSAVSCAAMIGLLLASDLVATRIFGKPELGIILRWISPGILGLSVLTLVSRSLQGLLQIGRSIFVLNIATNLILAMLLLLISNPTPAFAAAIFSACSLSIAVVGLSMFFAGNGRGEGHVGWIEIFNSCLPLWTVVFMGQLVQWSGQFVAGIWVEPEQLGQLAVAQRAAMLISIVLLGVNLVVAPKYAAMHKLGNLKGIRTLTIASVRIMLSIVIPTLSLILIFPEQIMSIFGGDFRRGAVLLQILAIGQFVNVATGSIGYLLIMSGYEKEFRNTVLISGPIAIGGALLLTPIYGVIGSAISTALAMSIQNLVAVWWVKKRLGFNTLAIWRTG